MPKPLITKVEIETFTYDLSDLARGEQGPTYSPGKLITNTAHAITIFTDAGVTGEYVWSGPIEYAGACVVAELLVGQDPLEREYIYSRIKQAMRQQAEIGISTVDIALWDLAGKYPRRADPPASGRLSQDASDLSRQRSRHRAR